MRSRLDSMLGRSTSSAGVKRSCLVTVSRGNLQVGTRRSRRRATDGRSENGILISKMLGAPAAWGPGLNALQYRNFLFF